MDSKTFEVGEALADERLDKALAQLSGLSRAKIKQLLEDDRVRLNGIHPKKNYLVKAGDSIAIVAGDADNLLVADASITIAEEFVRPDLLVVNKPANLPCAPKKPGELGTLANGLVAKYPELASIGDGREAGLVHRLDVDTSGLLVVARNAESYAELRAALKDERLEKEYLAIAICGQSASRAASIDAEGIVLDSGVIEHPIAPHPKDQKRHFACVHMRDVARLNPRPASTRYAVLKRFKLPVGDAVLVRVWAKRALRHQIRVHFASIGAPLLGDKLYGGPEIEGLARHALHASRIHYKGGVLESFDVQSPLPPELQAFLPSVI